MMEDSEMVDDEAEESVEDYFGMSPDWCVRFHVLETRQQSTDFFSRAYREDGA